MRLERRCIRISKTVSVPKKSGIMTSTLPQKGRPRRYSKVFCHLSRSCNGTVTHSTFRKERRCSPLRHSVRTKRFHGNTNVRTKIRKYEQKKQRYTARSFIRNSHRQW